VIAGHVAAFHTRGVVRQQGISEELAGQAYELTTGTGRCFARLTRQLDGGQAAVGRGCRAEVPRPVRAMRARQRHAIRRAHSIS
jgi:hypothetical protein